MSEIFPTKSRATWMSVGYSLAVAIFGGFAPHIATWLIGAAGSPLSPTCYPIIAAIASTLVLYRLRETAHTALRGPGRCRRADLSAAATSGRVAGMTAPLRLLGKASSINVRKVLWTCAELGIACDREDWGSGFRPLDTPAFQAISPHGLVPVIQLADGSFLRESNTICRYLAAGSALLPEGPLARARVEQWMDWQATELNSAWRLPFLALVRGDPAFAEPRALEAGIAAWNRQMALLDQQLATTGAYVAGASFTLADIVLGLSANRWRMTPMPHPALPALAAWEARLARRPGHRAHAANGIP
ncbi:glutathione S-transferase family protein [Roseomonas sp. 18066]|uniref:glutathione S-transferase family protein n=1 Tax=Roseomonas sp. 18066 TaxID=2681412 RepID=UPI00190F49F8|nr:glutathione S-transferase [Roseomonas sp. 18066]